MSEAFDLVILGSGPSASRVATQCAKEKWRIAVVDPLPVGGNCALRGCNPKKVLVRAAELVDRARMMRGKGTQLENTQIDWTELIQFKRKFTEPVTENQLSSFKELGIEVVSGHPQFTSPTTLTVDGRAVSGKKFLIATGAVPVKLPIEGAELMVTSDEFLELDELPQRVTFVGGGYISFEFAHVAARAGADVTIVEQRQPLAPFDQELVGHLIDRSKSIGIEVRSQTEVKAIKRHAHGSYVVQTASESDRQEIECDLVVHGAGRVPNVDGLDLEKAKVRFGKRGVEVNEYFQSVSNEAVYATGDVVASDMPPLTPAANYQGHTVAQNLLEGNVTKNSNPLVPSAVFSVPALAAVGVTEAEAQESGKRFRVSKGDWAKFSSMKKVGETHAFYKVLIDRDSNRILGAHLLGPEAAEAINLFTLAMTMNATASDLESTLFVFPTFVSDIRSML